MGNIPFVVGTVSISEKAGAKSVSRIKYAQIIQLVTSQSEVVRVGLSRWEGRGKVVKIIVVNIDGLSDFRYEVALGGT